MQSGAELFIDSLEQYGIRDIFRNVNVGLVEGVLAAGLAALILFVF